VTTSLSWCWNGRKAENPHGNDISDGCHRLFDIAFAFSFRLRFGNIERKLAMLPRLEAKLDMLLKQANIKYHPLGGLPPEIRRIAVRGKILLYRAIHGGSLKDAKEFIEAIERKLSLPAPPASMTPLDRLLYYDSTRRLIKGRTNIGESAPRQNAKVERQRLPQVTLHIAARANCPPAKGRRPFQAFWEWGRA
jgi:hypothetical protein